MSRREHSAEAHRHKVQALRVELAQSTPTALNRAVIECVRNPVVVRAVARGLRALELEKP